MTELYRGILLVLTEQFSKLMLMLRNHTRSHSKVNTGPIFNGNMQVSGFWNLMLEIVMTVYVIVCMTVGILLTASLAIISYPFAAPLNYIKWLLSSIIGDQPEKNKQPAIIKIPDGREKE